MVWRKLIGLGSLAILAVSAVSVNAATDLPVVDSAALGTTRNLPWSEPVDSVSDLLLLIPGCRRPP
ncbi:hypothetical protein H6G89_19240 [Oscillatoria sp. FACHB-1407]|uniref:hypothetical protein n=1 Tax=Oscillatoria sp. FACHB-1407 TaxID=2692847 RepID=UPI001682C258|nr:hypothetical protein [Oscillatoria sp. FACHB-1407]MBD2463175.1 hypothetical protein [Oscillatoria sp. FACHB-1407]